jgi:hypothetical protein
LYLAFPPSLRTVVVKGMVRVMEDHAPDSPLFLQINAQGVATVWIELSDLVSQTPSLYYRPDRCPDGALPFTFQLSPELVAAFVVSAA